MLNLTIRPMRPDELATFVALRNAANPWMRDESVDEIRQREAITPQRRLIAERGGIPVGVGAVGAGTFSIGQDLLVNVAVAEEARGQGIGTRLVDALLDDLPNDAKTLGCWVPTCCAGSLALARKYEFREMFKTRELKLELASFESAPHQNCLDSVATAGIRLMSLAEADSPEFRQRVFRLYERLTKRKRDAVIFDVGDFDEWTRKVLESPSTDLDTFTLAERDGELIGLATTWTWPDGAIYGFITAVLPEASLPHQSIELAMKLRNIEVLKARGVQLVRASESVREGETLNTRLGFAPSFTRIRGTRPVVLTG